MPFIPSLAGDTQSVKKKDTILSFSSMNFQRLRNEIPITQFVATPNPSLR